VWRGLSFLHDTVFTTISGGGAATSPQPHQFRGLGALRIPTKLLERLPCFGKM
jgi:hypothetical protein